MSLSRNGAVRQVEANPLAERLPGLIGPVRKGQPEGKLVAGEWLMPLIQKAVERTMSQKEGAILCGLSEPEFSKQLTGKEGKSLNVLKLGALGDRFALALADEIRAKFQIDDPASRRERAVELVSRGLALLVAEIK